MLRRAGLAAVAACALAVAAIACGDDTSTPAPTGPTATPNESNTLGIRQCELLTAEDVSGVLGGELTAAPYAENNGDTAICRYSGGGGFVAFVKIDRHSTQPLPSLVPDEVSEDVGDVAVWINFVHTLHIFEGDWIIDIAFENEGDGTREQAVQLAEIILPRLP